MSRRGRARREHGRPESHAQGRASGARRRHAPPLAAVLLVLAAAVLLLAAALPAAAAPAYRVYFGDLHTHTSFSDGKGTPEQAYAQAAKGGADFMAITDHREGLTAAEWARTQAAAAAATSTEFVGIPAYEVKPALGHVNVYGTSELPPIGLTGTALYDWLAAQGAVGQWNHPQRSSEDFDGFAYRTAARDAVMALLEVVNHGSVPMDPDYEASYVRALDKGWHVMPSANGDIHDASWITGNDERTALLAPRLTREALYAAMRARRGYATRLDGLLIGYTADGAPMGSTVRAGDGMLTVAVRVRGRDAAKGVTFSKLEIVSNGGKVVASSAKTGKSLDWTTTIAARAGRYYYLRVTIRVLFALDLKSAWTAPVWVKA